MTEWQGCWEERGGDLLDAERDLEIPVLIYTPENNLSSQQ